MGDEGREQVREARKEGGRENVAIIYTVTTEHNHYVNFKGVGQTKGIHNMPIACALDCMCFSHYFLVAS